MKYLEYISQLQIEDLRNIVETNNLKCNIYSQAALIKQILTHFTDRKFLRDLLTKLKLIEKTALAFILFSSDEVGVDSRRCDSWITVLLKGRTSVEEIIESLRRRGVVFNYKLDHYRQVYFVPDDLKVLLLDLLIEGVADRLEGLKRKPPLVTDDGFALEQDIFTFLAHVKRGDIRLTQAGTIFKLRQKKILADFVRKSDIPQPAGYYPYPPRFAFIITFCTDYELIRIDSSVIAATGKVINWLKLNPTERMRHLYHYYLATFDHSEWDFLILAIIPRIEGRGWITIKSLDKGIASFWGESFYDSVPDIRNTFLLEFLVFLGIIALGGPVAGDYTALRVTDLGRAILKGEKQGFVVPVESSCVLQPNYEILVPRNIDPLIRWELEEIAIARKTDQMMIYQITRDSIRQAFKKGKTEKDILSFLRQHTKQELPQNVEYSIRDWAREYGRIYFMEAFLLRCDSESLAMELKWSTKLSPFIRGELTSKDLIISDRNQQELVDLLEKEGYMPRAGVQRCEGAGELRSRRVEEQGS